MGIKDTFGDKVTLRIVDRNNFHEQTKIKEGWKHIDELRKEGNYESIKKRLDEQLEQAHKSGRISENCYRQGAGKALDRPMVKGRSRSYDPDGDRPAISEKSTGKREEAQRNQGLEKSTTKEPTKTEEKQQEAQKNQKASAVMLVIKAVVPTITANPESQKVILKAAEDRLNDMRAKGLEAKVKIYDNEVRVKKEDFLQQKEITPQKTKERDR